MIKAVVAIKLLAALSADDCKLQRRTDATPQVQHVCVEETAAKESNRQNYWRTEQMLYQGFLDQQSTVLESSFDFT